MIPNADCVRCSEADYAFRGKCFNECRLKRDHEIQAFDFETRLRLLRENNSNFKECPFVQQERPTKKG